MTERSHTDTKHKPISKFAPHARQATSPGGGWVTTSDLSVTVTEFDRQKTVSCYAVNAELGETISESKVVSVICK